MRVPITKKWCETMAKLAGDAEIGAGLIGEDPAAPPKRCETDQCDLGGECMYCGSWNGEACRDARVQSDFSSPG